MRWPIVVALILQVAAGLLQGGVWFVVAYATSGWRPDLGEVLLAQSVLSACLSYWRGMAPWWWLIQFAFPLAVHGLMVLHVPRGVFLSGFVFLLLGYWHTFRTRVPYYPSGRAMWEVVAECLPADRVCRVIDVGSGLGGLLLFLAARFPYCEAVGVELAPLPWLISLLRARWTSSTACFRYVDYAQISLAEFEVVVAYLSPAAMPGLWHKAQTEMRPGSVLFSYEFEVPGQAPSRVFNASGMRAPLYAWYI